MGRRGIECWYCQRAHPGGYQNCWQQSTENRPWKPRQPQQNQRTPSVYIGHYPRKAVVQECSSYRAQQSDGSIALNISVMGVMDQQ